MPDADEFTFKHTPAHEAYMREQIWECRGDLSIYSAFTAWEHGRVAAHIPDRPKVVMDLGCGLGRAAIYLNHVYEDPGIHYVLADVSADSPINTGAFDPEEPELYNNLELTASFAHLNGLHNFETFDVRFGDWKALPPVDFITSRCAYGMHVTIESILDQLIAVSSPDVVMIFGTRARPFYNAETIRHWPFKEATFIEETQVGGYPHQDWVILKGLNRG